MKKGLFMRFLTNKSMRFYLGFLAILLLTLGGSVVAAFADSGTNASVTINAGTLTETGPSSVQATAVTLNGNDQTTTYTLPLTVTDATGSGNGWNMTITSTQFSDSHGHTLPTTASNILTAPSVVCQSTGNHCTAPINSITYPLAVPAGKFAIEPTAVKFYNAVANSGLGIFAITPTVTITIPASTLTGTYGSIVDVAIVSGP